MDDLVLRSGDVTFALSPANGGRFSSLVVDGLEVMGRGGPGLYHWGSYAMAPFAGRVRFGRLDWHGQRHQLAVTMPPHAIHGVTVDRPWEVVEASATSALLRCGFDARWPWSGWVEQRTTLDGDRLHTTLSVHAAEQQQVEGPMPAWIGHHPWFGRRLARGEDVRISVPAAGILPKDGDGMPSADPVPVPAGPYDDVFTGVAWPARLVWDGALALEISSDQPWAVVYDERPTAVCVEPQTGPPNAAELGSAASLDPGASLSMEMTWTWSPA